MSDRLLSKFHWLDNTTNEPVDSIYIFEQWTVHEFGPDYVMRTEQVMAWTLWTAMNVLYEEGKVPKQWVLNAADTLYKECPGIFHWIKSRYVIYIR